jgi:lipid-A-disaccharide synthase-like uncharacterized protein
MLLRRLRGIIGATAVGTAAWAGLGFLFGIMVRFRLLPGIEVHLGPRDPLGVIATLTLLGAVVGFVNGLTFAILVTVTERGRTVAELRSWRVALWTAIAHGVGLHYFLFPSTPILVVIGAGLGALTSVALLHLARHGEARERSQEMTPAPAP